MRMREKKSPVLEFVLPVVVVLIGISIWMVLSRANVFPESAFPSPGAVLMGFREEFRRSLFDNIIASLFRVFVGFLLALVVGVPLGLLIGVNRHFRLAFLPLVNFFRSLSPLAWIPFAILWYGIGDRPTIFLIFMASVFPLLLATIAGVASIPAVVFRVADEYRIGGWEMMWEVLLPGIAPNVITAMRVTAGLAWVVVVAAEMISGKEGLGFAIWDARNGLRPDLLVVNMVVIGLIGVVLDRILCQLQKLPGVRWAYGQ